MTSPLKQRRGLIALNAGLLLALGAVSLAPEATAQRGAGRARGEYTLVSGRVIGGNSNAVYVIDSANQEIIGLTWNNTRKALEGFGYRDINADSGAAPGR
jgi:hypothetical protein